MVALRKRPIPDRNLGMPLWVRTRGRASLPNALMKPDTILWNRPDSGLGNPTMTKMSPSSLLPGVVRASPLVRKLRAYLWRRLSGAVVRIRGTGHRISTGDTPIIRGRIEVSGRANCLEIGDGARLWDVNIVIHGSGLVCRIGRDCRIRGGTLVVEDTGSMLEIGNATTLISATVVASEGGAVHLGDDCLVAAGVDIRNSDGHSIVDEEGRRLNPAADVTIGRHAWIGLGSQVLKGVTLGDCSVVGARSLVNRNVPKNTIVAGVPARLIRGQVDWNHRRL